MRSFRFHLGWMALYFAVSAITRTLFTAAADWDDAEQLIHSQFFELGYGPQPPLYEWITFLAFQIFPSNLLFLALLKGVFLWSIFYFIGSACRLVTKRDDLSIVMAYAIFLSPQLAWEAQRTLTHTVLATASIALCFYLFTKIYVTYRDENAPKESSFFVLGIGVATCFHSKYSAALILVFLSLAACVFKPTRTALFNSKLIFTVIVASVLCSPHAIWMFNNFGKASEETMVKLTALSSNSGEYGYVTGLLDFSHSLAGYLALPLFFLCGVYFLGRYSRSVINLSNKTAKEIRLPIIEDLAKVYFVYIAIFCLFCFGLIFLVGTQDFKDRWFTPFLFGAPIFCIYWIEKKKCLNKIFVVRGVQTVLVITTVCLSLRAPYAGWMNDPGRLNIPVEKIAQRLQSKISENTLLVSDNARLAGSLKPFFPSNVVLTAKPRVLELHRREVCDVLLLLPADISESESERNRRVNIILKMLFSSAYGDDQTLYNQASVSDFWSENYTYSARPYFIREIRINRKIGCETPFINVRRKN